VSVSALLKNLSRGKNLPITKKYQQIEPIIEGLSPQESPKPIHRFAPPCSDIQTIAAIFEGLVITVGFGKMSAP
jgi:hypothetical protein